MLEDEAQMQINNSSITMTNVIPRFLLHFNHADRIFLHRSRATPLILVYLAIAKNKDELKSAKKFGISEFFNANDFVKHSE